MVKFKNLSGLEINCRLHAIMQVTEGVEDSCDQHGQRTEKRIWIIHVMGGCCHGVSEKVARKILKLINEEDGEGWKRREEIDIDS